MTLPLLISVPHAGWRVPEEVSALSLLDERAILEDGDEGSREIYDLASVVSVLVTTEVARAFVDMNRAEDDRRKDGVVKTHTCWDVPIYHEPLPEDIIERLLARHHRPYHAALSEAAASSSAVLGVDCHTMAAQGPPVGPDPGRNRPLICVSNADGTCPLPWLQAMGRCLEESFGEPVSLNRPFRGGHIIRAHALELPWLQLEMSRDPRFSCTEKRAGVLAAFRLWCRWHSEGGPGTSSRDA